MKRPGNSTNEAADLKRPRTAPPTPIDPFYNGANPTAGRLMTTDPDDQRSRSVCLHASPEEHPARPSTTAASAPAALNRGQTQALARSPSVSTAQLTPGPASISTCGLGLANGPTTTTTATGGGPGLSPSSAPAGVITITTTTTGTVSGVVAAPQQPFLPHQHPQQQHQRSSLEVPGHPEPLSLPLQFHAAVGTPQHPQQHPQQHPTVEVAASSGLGGAPAAASPAGGSGTPGGRHPGAAHHPSARNATQHHHHNHAVGAHDGAHPAHHHRHDALEEQVFSPAFHRPASSAPQSAEHSPQRQTPAPLTSSSQQDQHQHQATVVVAAAVAAAACTAGAGERTAILAPQLQATPLVPLDHVHAIDLNVVEGVDVESEEEEGAAGDAEGQRSRQHAAAEPAGAGTGIASSAPRDSISGAAIAAVGEELSSGSSGGGGGQGEEARGRADGVVGTSGQEVESGPPGPSGGPAPNLDVQEEEEAEEEEDDYGGAENDENAPVSHTHAYSRPHHRGHRHPHPHIQRPPQPQPQQAADTVLVASAPRALAAAVAAVLPSAAAAAAAAAAQGAAAVTVVAAAAAATAPAAATPAAAADHAEDEEEDEEEEEDAFAEFDPLVFIRQLPPLEACVPAHRPALLPRPTRAMASRKTLVLDLDETLVHSSLEAVDRSDFSFPVVFNGTEHKVFVRQRPHLKEFMVRVAALYEVVVFTASQRIYAERLLDILDPGQQLVRHRIYRDSCVVVDGNYLKDLSILGRDLAHTIIVDNSPQAFGFQVDNGIPIESWYDDDSDSELLKLLPFLEALAGAEVPDVRPRIQAQFRLRELIDRA